jgi:elongation factor 1-beta
MGSTLPADATKATEPTVDAAAKAPAAADEDDVDLFGSDEEEDAEAAKVREERLAAYKEKKAAKPKVAAKSVVTMDIKPWDDETDLEEMEKAVRAIEKDGLVWGASKLVDVGFGIKKLQINLVVEDEKVSTTELEEEIQELEDWVQSTDIAAMQKL